MAHDTNPPIPDPALPPPRGIGPNDELPPLNVLKARSTIWAVLTIAGAIGPLIGGGVGEVVAKLVEDPDSVNSAVDQAANVVNGFLALVGFIGTWLERKAPHRRLSFTAPLTRSTVPPVARSRGR